MLDLSTGGARRGPAQVPGARDDGDVVVLGAPVSDHPDYIRMRGHINRVRSEFPALDPVLIERIHQHFVVVQLRQPTPDEFRAYVVELTTDLDEPTLRGMLGLPPKTSAGPTDGRHASGGTRARRSRPEPPEPGATGLDR